MAPMTSMMAMPDFGLKTDDVHYLRMETQIQGRGPNRLKYLDLEGRWFLSGKSIPYISQTFNHLNTLNSARVPMRDLNEEPLNAIGMVSWTKSSEPAPVEKKPSPPKLMRPPVFIEDEVPQSPREVVPHRSAGYGQAHQKRKLSVPDRSRSASPLRNDTTTPDFDKYAKFERNRKGDCETKYDNDDDDDDLRWTPPEKKELNDDDLRWTPQTRNLNHNNIESSKYDLVGAKQPKYFLTENTAYKKFQPAGTPLTTCLSLPYFAPQAIERETKPQKMIDWQDKLWVLGEEKVTFIRVVETEYYLDQKQCGCSDSITRYGTRWGDAGYGSSSPSPTGEDTDGVLPHRTPSLSRPSSRINRYDTEFKGIEDNVIPKNTSTLTVKTQNEKGANMPYRTHGYGAYHEKRHYDISPRSMGSTDYSSGSEQGSPNSYERSADEVVLLAYHSRGQMPRVNRQWIQ